MEARRRRLHTLCREAPDGGEGSASPRSPSLIPRLLGFRFLIIKTCQSSPCTRVITPHREPGPSRQEVIMAAAEMEVMQQAHLENAQDAAEVRFTVTT